MTHLPSTRNSKLETRNYFNYFTEIEDTFVRRRGKHLHLSPMDWALIESWKEMGVPLHIALRGIEQAFDSYEAKPRKRSVKTLLYCQEEVEAQYSEWLESRVGAHEEGSDSFDGGDARDKEQVHPASPFARPAILQHLQEKRAELLTILESRRDLGADGLNDALDRATRLLEDLENDFAAAGTGAQQLEVSLTGIERMLNEALRSADVEAIGAHRGEVKTQLRPYKAHMEAAAYELTFDNLLLKRLRDQFGIPRLSLFYL